MILTITCATNSFNSFELNGWGGLLANKTMNVPTDAKYMPGESVVPYSAYERTMPNDCI